MTHGAYAALYQLGIGDPAQSSRNHVAVLESTRQLPALLRIVTQPMQQLGKSPLMGIHATAPINRFEMFAMRKLGNFLRFSFGAMIAP